MKLGIYGAGGMGVEFLTLALAINREEDRWSEILFVDDGDTSGELCGLPVYPSKYIAENYLRDEIEFTISVGEPIVREKMAAKVEEMGYALATLVYPRKDAMLEVTLEPGVVIMTPNTGIGSFAHIGRNVLLQGYSSVGHGTKIGDNSNISCFVQISGNCKVGKNVFFGIQSVVKEGISIGDNAIIGMCAPVLRDVPSNYTVFHAPAKMAEHEPGTRALGGNYDK